MALPAYGDFPPPPGYTTRSRGNAGFIIVGAAALIITYGLGIGYAASTGFERGSGAVALPLAGPFVAAASRDFSCPDVIPSLDPNAIENAARACQEKSIREATSLAVLAGVGLGQLFGATLLTAGLLDRTKVWVRTDLVSGVRQRAWSPEGGVLTIGGTF